MIYSFPLMEMALVTTFFAAAAGHIWAQGAGRTTLAFWLKPLPILLALALVLSQRRVDPWIYQLAVALALIASMGGDILLALPRGFMPGLISFLIAHLLYAFAFLIIPPFPTLTRFGIAGWLLIPLAIYGAAMVALLWPHVQGGLRAAVVVYIGVILLMFWLAGFLWLARESMLTFVAALFFVASDSVLALDKFRGRIAQADAIVMITYYAAQLLFALSVMEFVRGGVG